MNLLIVDQGGVGLDFALRAMEAGHQVKIAPPRVQGSMGLAGRGLVERVPEWEKWIAWADLIVPTENGKHMDRMEDLRKLGYPIFGPSKESARLEIERGFGMQVFKKFGIDIPPYKQFNSLSEAEAHCWKQDRRYVFKTLGSEEDKSLTYVAKDSGDMIENAFKSWRRKGKTLKGPCMLQEVIEGIEFGVSAWMGSDGFLRPKGENFEHKKLMSGDYGPNTGEMGTLMWYSDSSRLFNQVLKPLEKFLLQIGHRGDIDVNCIIDEKGKPWPLEFTSRLGWPAFFIMCAQHEEPCQWMLDALNGRDTLKVSKDPFVGVLMAIPPFPNKYILDSEVVGKPIYGINEGNWSQIHLCDVMQGSGVMVKDGKVQKGDMFVTSGEYVLVVSGSGSTVRKARKSAYRVVDEINIRNAQVRDDIGESASEHLPKLQAHGYATGVTA